MPSPTSRRVRRKLSTGLAVAGHWANVGAERLRVPGEPTLEGDRWVEWSYCMARLADGPGRTLDFGADIAFLSLAAAQRGHDVVALDRVAVPPTFEHERVRRVTADILDGPSLGDAFDQVINCSSVEHVGLAGRYGSGHAPDGDLEAMATLRDAMVPGGRMILTIPVGRDQVCPPLHRIYGDERLPRLIDGFEISDEQYWRRDVHAWRVCERAAALDTQGGEGFYSLGLFVLRRP